MDPLNFDGLAQVFEAAKGLEPAVVAMLTFLFWKRIDDQRYAKSLKEYLDSVIGLSAEFAKGQAATNEALEAIQEENCTRHLLEELLATKKKGGKGRGKADKDSRRTTEVGGANPGVGTAVQDSGARGA